MDWLALSEYLYRFFGDLCAKRPDLNLLQNAVSIPVKFELPDVSCWQKYTAMINKVTPEAALSSSISFYDRVIGDNWLEMCEYSFYSRKDDYAGKDDELEAYYADYPYRHKYGLDTGHIALQLYYMADLRALSLEQAYRGDDSALQKGIMAQQMFYKRFLAVWWPFFTYRTEQAAKSLPSSRDPHINFYQAAMILFKCFMTNDTVFMQGAL